MLEGERRNERESCRSIFCVFHVFMSVRLRLTVARDGRSSGKEQKLCRTISTAYDTGSWSYYDLLHYSHASSSYHKLHIEQLRTLYELTGDEIFLYYSDKFYSYTSPLPPPPPPPTPENTLTVYTLPSAVTFTVNNVPHMTPWSEIYENGTLVNLVMPETHTVRNATYYWDQWSDGNTSRSRTFTMDTNITLAAYFTLSSPQVGGINIPVNKFRLLAPYIGSTILVVATFVTLSYIKKERGRAKAPINRNA